MVSSGVRIGREGMASMDMEQNWIVMDRSNTTRSDLT